VKLGLFGAMLALGGFHQFWLVPRVESYRDGHDTRRIGELVHRHFRGAIGGEVALGVGVLLVAMMLSGSARSQHLQQQAANLTQRASTGSATVELTPSALVAGRLNYDLAVTGTTARTATVTFGSVTRGIPDTTVDATPAGPGHFRVSGLYTALAGTWQVAVRLDDRPGAARYTLKIASKAPKPAKPPKKQPTTSTWAWGAAELLALVAALFASNRLSRALTARRRLATNADTTAPDDAASHHEARHHEASHYEAGDDDSRQRPSPVH
jgi:hypothetical protein